MRKFVPVILTLLLLSFCEKSEEGGNRPPQIDRVDVSPEIIYTDDEIVLTPTISDPDGDKVKLSYSWYRNGRMIPDANTAKLATDLTKGDKIKVEIVPGDGKVEGKPYTIGPLIVANAAPEITGYKLEPLDLRSDTTLNLTVDTEDADGDPILVEVRWEIDGSEVDQLKNRFQVSPDNFQRGQELLATVTASDGEESHQIRTSGVMVGNSAPKIVNYQKRYADGRCYITVQGEDNDGDPIAMDVTSGPADFSIDEENNTVSWEVSGDVGDVYTETLVVELSDPHGGRSSTEIPVKLTF